MCIRDRCAKGVPELDGWMDASGSRLKQELLCCITVCTESRVQGCYLGGVIDCESNSAGGRLPENDGGSDVQWAYYEKQSMYERVVCSVA